jgi:hypothetical protein
MLPSNCNLMYIFFLRKPRLPSKAEMQVQFLKPGAWGSSLHRLIVGSGLNETNRDYFAVAVMGGIVQCWQPGTEL